MSDNLKNLKDQLELAKRHEIEMQERLKDYIGNYDQILADNQQFKDQVQDLRESKLKQDELL